MLGVSKSVLCSIICKRKNPTLKYNAIWEGCKCDSKKTSVEILEASGTSIGMQSLINAEIDSHCAEI